MARSQELLLELLLLRLRYTENEFASVGTVLATSGSDSELGKILELLQGLSLGEKKSPKAKKPVDVLMDLSPAQRHMLTDFRSKVLARQILPEANDLRRFAERLGIKEMPIGKREQAAKKLLSALISLPSDEAAELIKGAEVTSSRESSKFGDLADAILRRQPRKPDKSGP